MKIELKTAERNIKNGKYVNCEICSKEFYINPSRLKNKTHCCSGGCSGKLASLKYSKKIKTNCSICNVEIFYKVSSFKQIANPTCSRSCSSKLKQVTNKGTSNPRSLKLNETEKIFWDRTKDCANRAKSKNIDFDIHYPFLMELYNKQNGKCYYSGINMDLKGTIINNETVFSVDRIDSTKGYTMNNIVLCINTLNRAKGNVTLEFFNFILNAIVDKINGER